MTAPLVTRSLRWLATGAILCAGALQAPAQAPPPPAADDFFQVSDPVTPYVAYAIERGKDNLKLFVQVDSLQADGGGISVAAGLSAAKTVFLKNSAAIARRSNGRTEFEFTVPVSDLVNDDSDWSKFRLGLSVAWAGGPFGEDRLRERFLHLGGALADGLSQDPADWAPLDLADNETIVSNRKQRIFIDFYQPMDGKASIVIDDDHGSRVRNLLSGVPMKMGQQRIEWDGLNDKGDVVPAGSYHWRAASHPGIVPQYLFSFYNEGKPPWRNGTPSSNWLADHSNAVAAATSGSSVYLGAPVAESGQNVIQLDLQGNETGHLNFPTLVGMGKLFLLADQSGFYAVMEGDAPYDPYYDLPDGTWQKRRPLNVMHWDTNMLPLKYDGPRGEKIVTNNWFHGTGPKQGNIEHPPADNLAGTAILDGHIYISLKQEGRIAILDSKTGKEIGDIKIDKPGLLATDGHGLLVGFSGKNLVRIDPPSRQVTPLFVPALSALPAIGDPEQSLYGFAGANATGMAVSSNNEIYLSDNGVDQDIKVFNLNGTLLREIGKKGGRPANGPWDGSGMYRPHGIALDQEGKLWVTETDTYPRRNSVWNGRTGQFIRDFFGPDHYGSPEGAFDIADHTRWIGGGELWKLDFDKKTASPVSTLFHQTKPGALMPQFTGLYWNFYHVNGRTFLIGYGNGQCIYEIRPDGSAKLWAIFGTLGSIAQMPRWTLPKAITDLPAVQALFAANAAKTKVDPTLTPYGSWNDKVKFNEPVLGTTSILWVDKNGDDLGEADEFEILPAGDTFITGGWGVGNPTLDLNMPAKIDGKYVLLKLKQDGFLPSGAPNYSLAKAVQNAVPLDFDPTYSQGDGGDSIQDRFGREIFNTTPMHGVDPSGKTFWTFPNRWVGVHGSHEAPLPRTGEIQGALYFLGTAPLDDKGEVFVMNGNFGRFFVMTTDGIYLDEFFRDGRVTQAADAYLIGGECFGGYFGKAEDGKYYLQSGHTDYRIFQINGLDQVKRSEGTVDVSQAQILAAQAAVQRKVVQTQEKKSFSVPEVPAADKLSANPDQWPGSWDTVRWGDARQPFPYVQVKALRHDDRLFLAYRVKDPSPWLNHGSDWTMLFKTGDNVDFQFSTDPKANPSRNSPAPGDKRLLVAPFQGKAIAVLYSYKEPGAKSPMSFSSPWQTVRVDRVEALKSADIQTHIGDGTYDTVISVPLTDLGLPPAGQPADLRGDFGVIYGDSAGSMDLLRSYWSNQDTGLVNDVPGETTISPSLWGTLEFNAPAK